MWFPEVDERVLSIKHKIHNWLKEGAEESKKERRSKISRSTSSRSSSSRYSKLSSEETAIQEKIRVTLLQAEASYIRKKRYVELQAESLGLEKEKAKMRARTKILEEENLNEKVLLEISIKIEARVLNGENICQ